MTFEPLCFKKNALRLLDQRKLPLRETWTACATSARVHWAIRHMVVRGAPAIGIAAAYGLYLGLRVFRGHDRKSFFRHLEREARFMKSSRPTGVNLRNVVDRVVRALYGKKDWPVTRLKALALEEAKRAHRHDEMICRRIGRFGAALLGRRAQVLTHCNAGGLATTGFGTALGVLYAAKAQGKKLHVFADETRPLLQGARLTAWELTRSGIPCTLLCDNFAAHVMKTRKIDCVIVGADRIAANGDTANKIGTYNVAVLAKAHGVPFYVAAPSTTFDFKIANGDQIPIEEREAWEVTDGFGKKTAPLGVRVLNPAFDVTPNKLITAFITEAGVLRPPFQKSLRAFRRETGI